MKNSIYIILISIILTICLVTVATSGHADEWVVVKDADGCYSYRHDDWYADHCYSNVEESLFAIKTLKAMWAREPVHAKRVWTDVGGLR